MKENDLKHFEYDSNNNFFIKQNTLGSPNSPFPSHQNSYYRIRIGYYY